MIESIEYKSKSGRILHKPIFDESVSPREIEGAGFCLACGEEPCGYVEPDARRYRCEHCGENLVFGLEELFLMGLVAE